MAPFRHAGGRLGFRPAGGRRGNVRDGPWCRLDWRASRPTLTHGRVADPWSGDLPAGESASIPSIATSSLLPMLMPNPQSTVEPQLWRSPPWRVRIQTADEEHWLEMQKPFALIGSHPRCDIQIGSAHTASVVYFACCFEDSIEVWPTAAIAFPRWGIVQPEHELLVGRHRLALHHPSVDAAHPPPLYNPRALPVRLSWGGREHRKVFRRPVTILGESHPSILRLHGQGLYLSDTAAVAQDGDLWLVDLVPDRWASAATPVRHLATTDQTHRIGRVTIRLEPSPNPQNGEPPSAASQETLPPATSELPLANRPGTLASPDMGGGATGGSDADVLGSGPTGSVEDIAGTGDSGVDASADTAFPATPETNSSLSDLPRAPTEAEPPKSDQFTAQLTRRLISINQGRIWRRRLAWGLLGVVGFGLAIAVISQLARVLVRQWLGAEG